ncbi:hypothetical protein MKW94_029382 [Papaver nudicaule]|uniref:DUF7903 domain-containing protein n=1 Tax=Papaver nudicaule TaxID=74823 RepID=A0AA41S743_PAPNU|nr:hypothetical protein [Papaver nudicaule]
MANYIPPHKRQLKDGAKPLAGSSLNSGSLAHKFQKNVNLSGSSSYNSESCSSERVMRKGKDASLGGRYLYPKSCLSRLCIIDSTEEEVHPYPGLMLKHISWESTLYKKQGTGKTPYVLVSAHKKTGTNKLNKSSSVENPLISVAEQILPNLLAFRNKRVEGSSKEFEEASIYFAARFGRVLFHGIPSCNMDTLRDRSEYEASLSQILRSFNTNVPASFTESVLNVVVPEIEVDFDEEKEYYYVRVVDKSHPEVCLSCKCTATGIETNNERHMIVDVACVEKDLDFRLMLSTRKIVAEPSDEEKHDLEKVIKSAVVDQNEKGGLKFPIENESFEGRYRVVGIGHITSKAFKNSSIGVKLNGADRYDFITSTAEVTNHVVLKMTGICETLKANNLETSQLAKMLEDNMELIWKYFLRLECCFT